LVVAIAQSKTKPGHGIIWIRNSSCRQRECSTVNPEVLMVEQLAAAEPADIAAVYGIGPEIAQSVYPVVPHSC